MCLQVEKPDATVRHVQLLLWLLRPYTIGWQLIWWCLTETWVAWRRPIWKGELVCARPDWQMLRKVYIDLKYGHTGPIYALLHSTFRPLKELIRKALPILLKVSLSGIFWTNGCFCVDRNAWIKMPATGAFWVQKLGVTMVHVQRLRFFSKPHTIGWCLAKLRLTDARAV